MSAAPRVVLAFDHFAKYAIGLGQGLSGLGCAIALLSRAHDLEFGEEQGAMRSFVGHSLGGDVRHEIIPGRVRDPSGLGRAIRSRDAIRRLGPDVVHLQDSVVNDARLVLASTARRRRFAMTVHDPSPHPGDRPRSRLKRHARRALVQAAGLIFVHADSLRAELLELERPTAPVVVVPHGIEAPNMKALPGHPSILFFGRVSTYKGLDTLLDAMPSVWARASQTTLMIAGDGDLPEHPVLEDARVTVRLEHVPESDVSELFADARVVALPYRQASQSGVGSLAKRYGRPIVATSVGGLPELVDDATGRLVPPEDPTALGRALIEVLTAPGLAESMGAAAVESALGESSWPRVAELTLDAYSRHLGHSIGRTVRNSRGVRLPHGDE